MPGADGPAVPVGEAEAATLFGVLDDDPSPLIVAVSGGPDSMALLHLLARRAEQGGTTPLIAATVDHRLRPGSAAEAQMVADYCTGRGIAHRARTWEGFKPSTGLPAAARMARYRMLGEIARNEGATRIVTAHTLDDQAETIVARLIAGSGVAGLAGMVTVTPLGDLSLVRPLLTVAKTRLVATCRQADIPFVRDPTNSDRTFLRGRLRGGLMPALEAEGLNATRLGRLGERMRRADEALHRITEAARAALGEPWQAEAFAGFPDEIRLRLLGGAIGAAATEGLVELGKLEALHARLATELPAGRFAATLAGAKVTLQDGVLTIVPAPARRDRTLADGRASREC